jgi:hypothetical protein
VADTCIDGETWPVFNLFILCRMLKSDSNLKGHCVISWNLFICRKSYFTRGMQFMKIVTKKRVVNKVHICDLILFFH